MKIPRERMKKKINIIWQSATIIMSGILKITLLKMHWFQTLNKWSHVLLMIMNKINGKIKIIAIMCLLNEKEKQGQFDPLQGENKWYC